MTRLNVKPGFRAATASSATKNYILLNRLASANEAMIGLTIEKLNQQDEKGTLLRAVLIQNLLSSRLKDKENGISPSRWMIDESRRISQRKDSPLSKDNYDDDVSDDDDHEAHIKDSDKRLCSSTTIRFKRSYGVDDDYAEVPDETQECPCGEDGCECSDEEESTSSLVATSCVKSNKSTAIKIHISQKRLKRDSSDSSVHVPVSNISSH